jgi:hypothetical protein
MAMNGMDPRKQFSKWLARFCVIVWAVFLVLAMVLMFFQPETAMACVWLVGIVTVNKEIDVLAYTGNSKAEKVLLAGIERTKLELGLKGIAQSISSAGKKEKDEKEDNSDEEGDLNEEEEGGNG